MNSIMTAITLSSELPGEQVVQPKGLVPLQNKPDLEDPRKADPRTADPEDTADTADTRTADPEDTADTADTRTADPEDTNDSDTSSYSNSDSDSDSSSDSDSDSGSDSADTRAAATRAAATRAADTDSSSDSDSDSNSGSDSGSSSDSDSDSNSGSDSGSSSDSDSDSDSGSDSADTEDTDSSPDSGSKTIVAPRSRNNAGTEEATINTASVSKNSHSMKAELVNVNDVAGGEDPLQPIIYYYDTIAQSPQALSAAQILALIDRERQIEAFSFRAGGLNATDNRSRLSMLKDNLTALLKSKATMRYRSKLLYDIRNDAILYDNFINFSNSFSTVLLFTVPELIRHFLFTEPNYYSNSILTRDEASFLREVIIRAVDQHQKGNSLEKLANISFEPISSRIGGWKNTMSSVAQQVTGVTMAKINNVLGNILQNNADYKDNLAKINNFIEAVSVPITLLALYCNRIDPTFIRNNPYEDKQIIKLLDMTLQNNTTQLNFVDKNGARLFLGTQGGYPKEYVFLQLKGQASTNGDFSIEYEQQTRNPKQSPTTYEKARIDVSENYNLSLQDRTISGQNATLKMFSYLLT